MPGGELLDHLIDNLGKGEFGLNGVQFDRAIKLLLARRSLVWRGDIRTDCVLSDL